MMRHHHANLVPRYVPGFTGCLRMLRAAWSSHRDRTVKRTDQIEHIRQPRWRIIVHAVRARLSNRYRRRSGRMYRLRHRYLHPRQRSVLLYLSQR